MQQEAAISVFDCLFLFFFFSRDDGHAKTGYEVALDVFTEEMCTNAIPSASKRCNKAAFRPKKKFGVCVCVCDVVVAEQHPIAIHLENRRGPAVAANNHRDFGLSVFLLYCI